MQAQRNHLTTALCLAFILLLASTAWSQNLQAVKARMLNRVAAVNTLKNQGVIGEGADGFLHFVGAAKQGRKLVAEENKDRRTVYQAIAEKEKTSAAKVGQRRAIQIASRARPGQMLQRPDGSWYKK